jgi:aspartate ammonia-lyase
MERARRNFQVSGVSISTMPLLVAAYATVKLAAARANAEADVLGSDAGECRILR